ncbi:DUF4422 domain-containing protein [Schaedlerella arabinosiphila]|jgi:hypothetical protein|uniref:DUF4422 domain-containing protein n=1 Tax=Schaedlerella arabinosiphila TaxID=2044587 RepID=UPI002557D097|nr:DUF4422 domain-containing protein [Schaedlerella arabinosiphila]
MSNLYQKENYDAILNAFEDKPFYIFGNTIYANTFYLYCKEKNADRNIEAFIISDMSKLKNSRKLHILHGVPIRDMNWLRKAGRKYNIFLAASEKTIREQLLPVVEDSLDGLWYYAGDFVNMIMYYHYVSLSCKNICSKYITFSSQYDKGKFILYADKYKYYYLYVIRVDQGYLPDPQIFNAKEEIDELYEKQLGSYFYVDERYGKSNSRYQCKIYVAKSHFDREIIEDLRSPFSETIQVGADLTDADLSELKDNIGNNISKRNRDYCEMTAVYWAWKNDKESDYIGLCHYRRRFHIHKEMILWAMEENYDAIYTIPQITDGGIREEFVERNYFLTPEIWDLIEEAIRKLSPEYLEPWQALSKSFFLIACNMSIMRRNVFEDYCSWVFSILEEVDRHYIEQGIQCNNRYLGYIAELLNTVFVMKNKTTLKKGYVLMERLESKI